MAQFILGNALGSAARKHRFLQRLLWSIDFGMIWLLIKTFSLLPPDTASNMGSYVGRLVGPRLARKTEMFRENLSTAFPEKNEAELKQLIADCWASSGRVLAEYPHFNNIFDSRDRERLHIEVPGQLEDCINGSRPAIIVTAHHCNWEMVGSAMGRLGIANSTLYSPPTNPLLDNMLLASRRKLNCELVPRDNAARALMRAINKGRSAGMVMDRRVDDGKLINFFGKDKPSTILPAKLAIKFGLDLVPVRVQRLNGAEFKVIFHPPVHPSDASAGETEQAIDMISQVHALFEDWIRAEPQDWFCPKRIWPKDTSDAAAANDGTEVNSYAA